MNLLFALLAFLGISIYCAYHRFSLVRFSILTIALLAVYAVFIDSTLALTLILIISLTPLALFNITALRSKLVSKKIFTIYKKMLPNMSKTEEEALAAGDVGFEAELFSGKPNWQVLENLKLSVLNEEEKAFIKGPVQTVCDMTSDWDVTHKNFDLSAEVWQYLKKNGFFGLIIPKNYGGKEFSAAAHSEIITRLSSCSITLSTTVAVPNSLGPAELLLHYGTREQKDYYLPRLATGEEIPCFALTSPTAGSDAGSIPDNGVVCYQDFAGKNTLGIKLNFDKRYITLAPIATVVGLAFKLYDPEKLLGGKVDYGMTCALIPRDTVGMQIGKRHFPLNVAFQNGPIVGKDVFIPIDWIIGGQKMAGHGWKMLVNCLSVGRAISLPATATGGAKLAAFATSAYARIRRQFNLPIGYFEGIEEALARIITRAYTMESARLLTMAVIDEGKKPSVASAILKYHLTELGQQVAKDAMDIHAGKGICLGPNNYLGRGYQAAPIAITVEGANILTRNMIIYGQGSIRCHPYIVDEMHAAKMSDQGDALKLFDSSFWGHVGFGISNLVRTLLLSFSNGRLHRPKVKPEIKRHYQKIARFSAALACSSDFIMMALGGSLKRRERVSARLGDVLSLLYLASANLKSYQSNNYRSTDKATLNYSMQDLFYKIQDSLFDLYKNLPNKWLGKLLSTMVFPLGKKLQKPSDKLAHEVCQSLLTPTSSRTSLKNELVSPFTTDNPVAILEEAFHATIQAEKYQNQIKQAVKDGSLAKGSLQSQVISAIEKNIISESEGEMVLNADNLVAKAIAVDAFESIELKSNHNYSSSDFIDDQLQISL